MDGVMRRRSPRHDLHLMLTILTAGFWGPCWIITVVAAMQEPWRCRECGRPQPEELKELDSGSAGTVIGPAFGLARPQAD